MQDPLIPVGLCSEESAAPCHDVQKKERAPRKDRGGWDLGLEQSAEMTGNEELSLHRTFYYSDQQH